MPTFASKYDGTCRKCGNRYKVGDSIYWEPGKKAIHAGCSDYRPKITIEENGDWLELSFPYDESLVALVKSLPVRKYDPDFKVWTVPNTEETRRRLEAGGAGIKEEKSVGAIELRKTLTVSDADTSEKYPFLFKHQAKVVNTVVSGKTRLYLGLPPGAGKTFASFASMDAIDAYPVLVVCLAGIKVNWQREVKKFFGVDAQILESRTPSEITEKVAIINYDVLEAWAPTLKKHKFKSIIFDESAYIKSPEAKRTKAAEKVAKGIKNIMLLSGTPTPTSPYDLIPPLRILGELDKYGGKKAYVSRYCPPVETRYGVSHSQYTNLAELHENLKKTCFISWKKEELIDLPALNVYDDFVEGKSLIINQLVRDMDEPTISEAYRVLKEHKDDSGAGQFSAMRAEAGSAKIKNIIEEASAIAESDKVIVGVHHREVNDEVFKALSKRFKTRQIIGGISGEKRQEAIDSFQDGDTQILVMNIIAGGVGINLQNASHMILGELPVSYADQDQVISRIYRSGQKNKVFVKRMVALGTIDDVLVHLIEKKKGLHNALMSGESPDPTTDIMKEMARYLVQQKEKKS